VIEARQRDPVAMSAARGYALATGKPQAVSVHTDLGTANLWGRQSRAPGTIFRHRVADLCRHE